MRWRALLLLPTLGLGLASVSCPWSRLDAFAEPEPPPIVVAQAAPSSAPQAAPPPIVGSPTISAATTANPVDPALAAALPPELVDDGSDDVKDPDPTPPPPSPRDRREI